MPLVRQPMRGCDRLFYVPPELRRLSPTAPDRSPHTNGSTAEQTCGNRTAKKHARIAIRNGQRLTERLLERMAENQPEQQRRLGNIELAKRVTDNAEKQRKEKIEHVVTERIHPCRRNHQDQ